MSKKEYTHIDKTSGCGYRPMTQKDWEDRPDDGYDQIVRFALDDNWTHSEKCGAIARLRKTIEDIYELDEVLKNSSVVGSDILSSMQLAILKLVNRFEAEKETLMTLTSYEPWKVLEQIDLLDEDELKILEEKAAQEWEK